LEELDTQLPAETLVAMATEAKEVMVARKCIVNAVMVFWGIRVLMSDWRVGGEGMTEAKGF
jgi:hypothetical protein